MSIIIFTLVGEILLRFKFSDTAYVPGKKIKKIQAYLALKKNIGYLWKPNLHLNTKKEFDEKGIGEEILTTDKYGFRNTIAAISQLNNGKPPDVIGLGDSFMHNAAYVFYNVLKTRKLFYYNMAMFRQCPGQYNLILKKYALKYKPKIIIYGVSNNDPLDLKDFIKWKKSGLDWFTYHSSTWCGPAIDLNPVKRFIKSTFRGWYAFYRHIRKFIILNFTKKPKSTIKYTTVAVPHTTVLNYIKKAIEITRKNNIKMILVFIPDKFTVTDNADHVKKLITLLAKLAKEENIPFINFKNVFNKYGRGNVLKYYYKTDSHWNTMGMKFAMEYIYKYAIKKYY